MLTKIHEELSESYLAVAESIPHARLAVTQFVTRNGITGEPWRTSAPVTEAATNAVRHAYPNYPRCLPRDGGRRRRRTLGSCGRRRMRLPDLVPDPRASDGA